MRYGTFAMLLVVIETSWLRSAYGQVASITVGPNVQVSTARSRITHGEVFLAADPSDARRLLACSIAGVDADLAVSLDVAYASFDGGRSWEPVATDSAGGTSSDPACTYGPDGHAYFTALDNHQDKHHVSEEATRVRAFSSVDGGRSWGSTFVPGAGDVDRTFVVADQTAGQYRGRVYIWGQARAPDIGRGSRDFGVALWRSRDQGVTFERAVQRFPRKDDSPAFNPGNAVVLTDGTVAMLTLQPAIAKSQEQVDRMAKELSGSLMLFTSPDGGETLSPATHIADSYGDQTGVSSLAADPGSTPFRDRLYVAWSDGRFAGRMQALLSYSADHGKTWSTPRRVNDDWRPSHQEGAAYDATMPTVAVNKEGVVGVMWHDRRNNPPKDETDFVIRFAASLDGGETFLPSVVVSGVGRSSVHEGEQWALTTLDSGASHQYADVPSTGFQAVVARGHWPEGGHTDGISADANGVFHLLWIDGRTGVHQLWTAPVTVTGTVVRHGTPALAALADLSGFVDLQLSAPAYDSATRTLTVQAHLVNLSPDTVRGPLDARLLTIVSDVGQVRLVGSAGANRGEGTVIDFTPVLPRGGLPPRESSPTRTLQFTFTDVRAARDLFQTARNQFPSVLRLEGLVLGAMPAARTSQSR